MFLWGRSANSQNKPYLAQVDKLSHIEFAYCWLEVPRLRLGTSNQLRKLESF